MRLAPAAPRADDLSLFEIFHHPSYTEATPERKAEMQLASARFRYRYEEGSDSLAKYFGDGISLLSLRDRRVLDLGSFTGGRIVYWKERYGFGPTRGIDIDPLFAEAAARFAAERGLTDISFDTGVGEALPYEDQSFDAILSLDVFEHVQSVENVLRECWRVLKPGGVLLACFPPFFQPLESHLDHVTKVPGLQLLFSGRAIAAAYHNIIESRGPEAAWYGRTSAALEAWERSPVLNGITVRHFQRIVGSQGWETQFWATRPIFSDGRRAARFPFPVIRAICAPLARLRLTEEVFLGRICTILRRPTVAAIPGP